MAIGVEPEQRISVTCPGCGVPITGWLRTEGANFGITFDGLERIPMPDSMDGVQVVNFNADFPFDPSGPTSSAFLDMVSELGYETFQEYAGIVGDFRTTAATEWAEIQRAYHFYLNEDWGLFDRSITRITGEKVPADVGLLERFDFIHKLVMRTFFSLGPSGNYREAKREIWRSARVDAEPLARYFALHDGELRTLQGKLFDQLGVLVKHREAWLPALAAVLLEREGRDLPPAWRMPTADFVSLRDAYRENFEVSSQALFLAVAIKNVEEGRAPQVICDPTYSSGWMPPGSIKDLPRTIPQFRKARAEIKELYLDRYPKTAAAWASAFDRRLRNAIAHGDARLDLETSQVVTGKGQWIPYPDFAKAILNQTQLILLFLDLAKLCRIYALSVRS